MGSLSPQQLPQSTIRNNLPYLHKYYSQPLDFDSLNMCYTVVKETAVCQRGHCSAFQVAWRRCRRSMVYRLSGLEPDHYKLCKDQDRQCLLPIPTELRIPCGNCGICQVVGVAPISIDGVDLDHVIAYSEAIIRDAEKDLEVVRLCRNYLEDTEGAFDPGLERDDPALAAQMSYQHMDNALALYDADIVQLECTIIAQKQTIRSRAASIAAEARERYRNKAIEQFRSANDWKWRYYGSPKNPEMTARPQDYLYEDFLPSQEMLQSHGVGLTGLCNWQVTPLHRVA